MDELGMEGTDKPEKLTGQLNPLVHRTAPEAMGSPRRRGRCGEAATK